MSPLLFFWCCTCIVNLWFVIRNYWNLLRKFQFLFFILKKEVMCGTITNNTQFNFAKYFEAVIWHLIFKSIWLTGLWELFLTRFGQLQKIRRNISFYVHSVLLIDWFNISMCLIFSQFVIRRIPWDSDRLLNNFIDLHTVVWGQNQHNSTGYPNSFV